MSEPLEESLRAYFWEAPEELKPEIVARLTRTASRALRSFRAATDDGAPESGEASR